jgi:hypothetical protein
VDPYLAAYTNPNREALTNTDWMSPSGLIHGIATGQQSYNVQLKKTTEGPLHDAARSNEGANIVVEPAHTQQMGSFRYTEPRQQDIEVIRNDPGILDAFRTNPYTQSLASVA